MKQRLLEKNAAFSRLVSELFRELESQSDETLNRRPETGGWSALQIMHHLLLAERLALMYVRKKLQYGDDFETAGITTAWRRLTLWFYLNLPFKFKAPAVVNEEKLPEYSTCSDTRAAWMQLRQEWTDFFQGLPESQSDKAVYKHPLAGRLSWDGMFVFFTQHFLRHRAQLRRTLQNFPNA